MGMVLAEGEDEGGGGGGLMEQNALKREGSKGEQNLFLECFVFTSWLIIIRNL